MAQNVLPFQYEAPPRETGMTGLGGLPLYLDLMYGMSLHQSITEHIGARVNTQGWTDSEMIHSLILLNLAGGDCVDDLKILEADEGFRLCVEIWPDSPISSRLKRRPLWIWMRH